MKNSQAFILSIGIVLAALIFGVFFFNARATDETVQVVGAATMRFNSDVVKWRVTLNRSTGLNNVSDGYRRVRDDLNTLREFLTAKGLKEDEITVQPINSYQQYGREGQPTGYNIQQSVLVITSKADDIEEIALNPTDLLNKGIVLQNSNLEYFYSKLSDIKLELLSEATADARNRANKIAENSGKSVGDVVSLRAGVFQIKEPYSTEISDYGVHNTRSKEKEIMVTVRAQFKLQ
ncbi:MAG: DUF541 domain-containing protein [candidate division Zixibacteria bacterium]|nr:DUF541 domain-containing protein [candidate division Zixibacteria bacterium]